MTKEYRGLALAGAAVVAFGAAVPAFADHTPATAQTAGAGYAGFLQSFSNLGFRYNALLDSATDCEVPVLAGSALECRVAPMHVWGQVDYATSSQDGDLQLGDYRVDRWSVLVGFDTSISPAAVVGASVGKVGSKVDFEGGDTRLRGDGWQAGLYAAFDPGQFYVKALGGYTAMDGDARRSSGELTAGTIEGDPDIRLWSAGLHSGYRLPIGATSVITPYLNYDWTNAKLKGFDETGGDDDELTASAARQKHSWLTAGVKLAGEMAGLVPQASIGYRHMFGERRASLDAAGRGHGDSGFEIVSMTQKRGALLAGLGIGGKLGTVDLRVSYQGAFTSDMKEHGGLLKLVVPLGSVGVPPPPPPLDMDPPQAPAPDTQTCPDGSVSPASEACPGQSLPAPTAPSERG